MLNQEIETIEREKLQGLQLDRLKFTIGQAFKTSFYKKRFAKIGLVHVEDIRSLSDIKKFHLLQKTIYGKATRKVFWL